MLIARLLYPIEVLGVGKRVGIWVSGCNRRCRGCSNPELWEFDQTREISVESILKIISGLHEQNPVDGFTITGGEPFDQEIELAPLVRGLKELSQDIIVYTGYTINELRSRKGNDMEAIFNDIAVLIDGRYIDEQNKDFFMKGSGNQNIIVLNSNFKKTYSEHIANGRNKIQNFRAYDGIISVGIHKRGFIADLDKRMKEYGIEAKD